MGPRNVTWALPLRCPPGLCLEKRGLKEKEGEHEIHSDKDNRGILSFERQWSKQSLFTLVCCDPGPPPAAVSAVFPLDSLAGRLGLCSCLKILQVGLLETPEDSVCYLIVL